MHLARAISAVLSLAALVATSAAQAAGPNKASADIVNLKIALIDLRPDYGDLSFGAGASTYTSAVPEPATYGMLLAGLAIVGLRRRCKPLRRPG